MASRGKVRGQKTTKSRNFNLSRRDTATALLEKRHFTRALARISHAQHLSLGREAKFPCAVMPTRGAVVYERALFMIEPRDLVFRLAAHMDAETAIEVRVLLGENDGKMRLAPPQGVELRQHALGQRIRDG